MKSEKLRLWCFLAITFGMITNQVRDRSCDAGVTQRCKERLLIKTKQVGSEPNAGRLQNHHRFLERLKVSLQREKH